MTTEFIDPDREDKWSASSAERVHYCAGSPQLIASLPPEAQKSDSGEAAESGVRIHAALETGDDSELEMSEGEIKERLSKLEQDAVSAWVESILDPNRTYSPLSIREQRMWVLDGELNKVTSAKVDVAWVSFQHGIVLDYKSGYRPTTPAQRNLQAKVQAVALWQETGVSRIRVVIAQHRFSSMVTQADYTEEDLQRAYQEILYDDWHSKQPDAQRVPGTWCQYCPAKFACREALAYSMLPVAYSAGVIPDDAAKKDVIASIALLPLENVAKIQRKASFIRNILDACSARLKSLPADQLAAVGLQLVEGRNQMEVYDFSALVDRLYDFKDDGLLTDAEFAACFEFKIGQLEAALLSKRIGQAKSAGIKLTQDTAKQQLRSQLSGCINFTASKTAPALKEIS